MLLMFLVAMVINNITLEYVDPTFTVFSLSQTHTHTHIHSSIKACWIINYSDCSVSEFSHWS